MAKDEANLRVLTTIVHSSITEQIHKPHGFTLEIHVALTLSFLVDSFPGLQMLIQVQKDVLAIEQIKLWPSGEI